MFPSGVLGSDNGCIRRHKTIGAKNQQRDPQEKPGITNLKKYVKSENSKILLERL